MSSSKTVFPGMEGAYSDAPYGNFNNQSGNMGGTRFPNMDFPSQTTQNQKPIVGFLYSISKTNIGEFWPLRIGSNRIGRSIDCDICLEESTVSAQHADLVIRQMKNPEKVIASICDARSTCGTMINGESLGFDPKECFNGDIITIGEHYDLYFILINSKQLGLSVCREFSHTDIPMSGPYNQPTTHDGPITDGTKIFDDNNARSPYSSRGMNGNSGTSFM